jgi:hypothetical protein
VDGETMKRRLDQLPVVRNVTIGRGVRLDPLAWRKLGSEAKFRLDTDTLEIVAQGHIDLGRRRPRPSVLHRGRRHAADGEPGRGGPDGRGLHRVHSLVQRLAADDAAKRRWADRLRARTFTSDDLPEYRRFWFGDTDERQDPVTFWENVYDDRAKSSARRIYQTSMLFARDLPGEGRELLLAIEMEPQGGDLTHEIMVGIPLEVGEFEA